MMRALGHRRGARIGALSLALLAAGRTAQALSVGFTESWSNGTNAGWTCRDLINEKAAAGFTVEAGALKVVFAKQSMSLPPEEYLLRADAASSGGAFVGDYKASGVLAVSLRLFCPKPAQVRLLFGGAPSGRVWQYRLPPAPTGQWTTVRAPLDPNLLRSLNRVGQPASIEADLGGVAWVGVAIQRNASLEAQTYLLDDFAVVNQTPFAAWMAQFADPPNIGTGNCNRLPEGDLDGDGASNYDEWVAGTSAADAGDYLAVSVAQPPGEGEGVVLKWNAVPGRVYNVWRATDLGEGFAPLSPDLPATPPENTYTDDTATTSGPYFYRTHVTAPGQAGE